MVEKIIYYNIAGLQLQLTLPKECDISKILPTFEPFRLSDKLDTVVSCCIYISQVDIDFNPKEAKLLSDISIVWGDRFTFYEAEDYYWTLIQYSKDNNKFWKMRSSKDFQFNTIYLGKLDDVHNNFLSWYSMVVFAQSALKHQCVLFHASVVINEKYGYAFLGKSGTGKSTHSRLWINHNKGFTLLNDDNPAIRIIDDQVVVYGTPWSGKTKCYINDSKMLKGLVRLKQAPFNLYEQRKNKEALLALIPSCSAIRWNSNLYSTLISILIEIIARVPIAELQCLPDEDAAIICYNELNKNVNT